MKRLRGEAHSHRLRHKRTPGETEGDGAGFETQECEENSHQCWRGATGHKGTGNKRLRRSGEVSVEVRQWDLQWDYLCESMSQDFSDHLETSIPAQACGILGVPRTLPLLLLRTGELRN